MPHDEKQKRRRKKDRQKKGGRSGRDASTILDHATHEAGHYVMGRVMHEDHGDLFSISSFNYLSIEVDRSRGSGGCVSASRIKYDDESDISKEAWAHYLLGGIAAQVHLRRSRYAALGGNEEEFPELVLARDLVVTDGEDDLETLQKLWPDIIWEDFFPKVIARAKHEWARIQRVAAALAKKKRLTGDEALVAEGVQVEAPAAVPTPSATTTTT